MRNDFKDKKFYSHFRHFLVAVVALLIGKQVSCDAAPLAIDSTNKQQDGDGCKGGTCPGMSNNSDDNNKCGMWLGPSPIKEHEKHGFGLGIFTGRNIAKGAVLDGEVMVPFFDYDDRHHPPLREYLWQGGMLQQNVLESFLGMDFFLPGLASLAPCTSKNFNLAYNHRLKEDKTGVHRFSDAQAGAFSYLSNSLFSAVRDIAAGEELTVECLDDDFDGGTYYLSEYDPKNNRGIVGCLDDKVRVDTSTIPKIGKGLIAKRKIKKGETILSSPVLPVHGNEMILDVRHTEPSRRKLKDQLQMLINYCFYHHDSNLLMLPYGPMFNYVNHAPTDNAKSSSSRRSNKNENYASGESKAANSRIQWHTSLYEKDELSRREEHHHTELFNMTVDQITKVHGKGLLIDLVASVDIEEGEEVFIDYGDEWAHSLDRHKRKTWPSFQEEQKSKGLKGKKSIPFKDYISASDYTNKKRYENQPFRTIMQQRRKPYPSNLETACNFGKDWVHPSKDEEGITYKSWNDNNLHNCLLPCIILERQEEDDDEDEMDVEEDEDFVINNTREVFYTAKLVDVAHQENSDIPYPCHLRENYEYIYTDIPQSGIRLVDKPYSTDTFLEKVFRHPIGVPKNFYSESWLDRNRSTKKLRGNRAAKESNITSVDIGEEFKRRKVDLKPEQGIKVPPSLSSVRSK